MPRPFTNDVPIAPFSLVNETPISSKALYAKLNYRRYLAASGKAADTRATRDPKSCPHCGFDVEWARTFKRDPNHEKGGENFIYARCRLNPVSHRWGFRNTDPKAETTETETQTTTTPPPEAQTTTQTETTDMSATQAVANGFDTLFAAVIDSRIGARLTDMEKSLKDMAKTAQLDPAAVAKMVETALNNARKVEITIPAMPKVKFEGKAHPALERVLTLIAAGESFFMLVGPAASGKSTLAKQVAKALSKKLTACAMTETKPVEEILGWNAPNLSTGEVKYKASAIVEAWERGDVILVDEVDRGNPNTLCSFNSIEQRVLYVPRSEQEGGSEAVMGEGAVLICTANTYGTGASRTYVGANQLDAAFLDRFRMVEVSYDTDLEIAITGSPEAIALITAARKLADKNSVRRPLTTRMARRAVTDAAVSKCSVQLAFKALCENAGWTATEISSVWN